MQQQLFDLVSRIDERLGHLLKVVESQTVRLQEMSNRIDNLHTRLVPLEIAGGRSARNWDRTADFVIKLLGLIVGAAILWKLGIKP